jgi:hypothetical protein
MRTPTKQVVMDKPKPKARLIKKPKELTEEEKELRAIILPSPPDVFYDEEMARYVQEVIDVCGGSVKLAARKLELSTTHIYNLRNGKSFAGLKTCGSLGVERRRQFRRRKQ